MTTMYLAPSIFHILGHRITSLVFTLTVTKQYMEIELLHHLWYLGPLHTQAKSRDREIVRAQLKASKGRPKTPPKSCSVVTYPQV